MNTALVWLRRDLRTHDHAALHAALSRSERVHVAFVLDTAILSPLPRSDRRVSLLLDALQALDAECAALRPGAGLLVLHGDPQRQIPRLAARLGVQAVHASHDDEPAALARDAAVAAALAAQGIAWHSHKDHVVYERSEVLSAAGAPYTVFTPYKNAWLRRLAAREGVDLMPLRTADLAQRLAPRPVDALRPAPDPAAAPGLAGGPTDDGMPLAGVPSAAQIGFETVPVPLVLRGGAAGAQALLADFLDRIDDYDALRDFPARKGPSYLGTALRFGFVSIRELARHAWQRQQAASRGAATWLSELIWRDFYHQLLHHHPHVTTGAFKPAYDALAWNKGPQADATWQAWCEGRTGYPLVDAGMRQLRSTGYMHNRLRMVTASFLCKHLGLDWRRGEAWFAAQLYDFDLAANNGGWQWSASSGCDAQPWFRIFNPVTQSERFDAAGAFIRRHVPELAALPAPLIHAPWQDAAACAARGVRLGEAYPLPVVDHATARAATLARYGAVRGASPATDQQASRGA